MHSQVLLGLVCGGPVHITPYLAAPGPGSTWGCSEHRSLGGTADLCLDLGFRLGLETSLAGRIQFSCDVAFGSKCNDSE